MQENDFNFINEVADFYTSTIDESHPQGNLSAVADKFAITRAKVNKILITAGVIDSPLHQDIMKLKAGGYDTDDIASALGVSAATVKINMPYEKVVYNGEVKSAGAGYIEKFRKREAILLENQKRKPTELEIMREMYIGSPEYEFAQKALKEMLGEEGMEALERNRVDDPIHLSARFSNDEAELFKINPDLMILHIELDSDLSEVKKLAGIKYGKTISRDILVPMNMPLHNLHYAIQQLFGFENYHLHNFKLIDEDLRWVTDGKVQEWKKLIGLVFKNPARDEEIDYWDDDYEGGSAKKYMRSKYTGPRYSKIFEESYPYIRAMVDDMEIDDKNLEDLIQEFYLNPFEVNETVTVGEILTCEGHDKYESVKEYYDYVDECIENASEFPDEDMRSQPLVYSFAGQLTYEYDYGDGWSFIITPHEDAEYLVEQGRISINEMREAIKDVCTITRPVVLALDGLPLVEDVGGIYGYMDFLRGINGLPSDMYEDKEESLTWAKSLGWKSKVNKKTLL